MKTVISLKTFSPEIETMSSSFKKSIYIFKHKGTNPFHSRVKKYFTERFKRSTSYGDEIAWAALWLYWATDDDQYLTVADDFISEFNLDDVNSSPTGNLNSRRGFIIKLNRGTII